MTKQVRDWNKDMNMIQAYLENRHLTDYTEQRLAGEPVANVIYYWLQQYAAAEAREKKLREAIEEVLRDAFKWENPYEGYNDLQKVLASLYPKEEEAK